MTQQDKRTTIPTVSIGMPVYNGEKLIRKALDSLLAQVFTDFELIISDNASTDDTETICREYAMRDPRIRYVRQPENRGALANFQYVLDEAVGEYFMWACHDDRWGNRWLQAGVNALNINSDVVGAFGFVRYFCKKTKELTAIDCPPYWLHGAKHERIKRYITINFPDHLFYSLFKRKWMMKTYFYEVIQSEQEGLCCLEKLLILEAVLDGGFADTPDMECEIYYLLKTKEEKVEMGLKSDIYSHFRMLKNMSLLIYKRNPFHKGAILSLLFIAYRFPIMHKLFNTKLIEFENRKLIERRHT